MLDVSVVVPFYNPGANIEDCLASLRDQTLASDRYEVLLVDDGSTDGSERRAQRYVDAAPERFRLIRIPASGWPGRPRNVGVDEARGCYIQFVDSDDSLDEMALERLLEVAQSSDADIVVGKLTSDFRGLNHHVFRHTVTGRTLYDYPLVDTLTPHKMVRKSLLTAHGIRFAEGPRHVEDEHFSMQIYTRAHSVAVVGDLACYFYRRRRVSGRNLGDTEAIAADYFRDLGAVLDVIDEHVADPQARIPLQRRFYRSEMLGRLRGRAMASYDDSYRREVLRLVRDLATTRIAPEVRDRLPVFIRTQSRLMLDNNVDALFSFSTWLDDLRLVATVAPPTWRDGRLHLALTASLQQGNEPLRLERDGSGWLLPASAAPEVDHDDRLVSASDLSDADLDCATISRALSIAEDGSVRITGEVSLDPDALKGGQPLTAGLWDVRMRVSFGGVAFGCPLRPVADADTLPAWLAPSGTGKRVVQPFWTSPAPTLALDIDEWSHPLVEIIDDSVPPILHRRDFELAITSLAGPAAGYPAQLLLFADATDSPPVTVPATLSVAPTGSSLTASLPRHLEGSATQIWLRIGEPGGSPARRLNWPLRRDGRRLSIVRSSGVHLR
jgi:glycosyltransferase involved in cell wall biosynthesis